MECLGHGTPELPTPLAGERPDFYSHIIFSLYFPLFNLYGFYFLRFIFWTVFMAMSVLCKCQKSLAWFDFDLRRSKNHYERNVFCGL